MTGKFVASRSSEHSRNSKAGSRQGPNNFHLSPAAVPHMEKVYSIVRRQGRKRRNVYESRTDIGRFLGLGSEKKWNGTYSDKPDGDWDTTAELMMLNFADSGHPVFRATSALERVELRSKGKGRKCGPFNGSVENIELILRTVISVNQLSIYGAVADLCRELSKDSEVSAKLAANEDLESMEILRELPIADPHTNAELQGNLLQ